MAGINPLLLKLANMRADALGKQAFVPAGGDPSGMGMGGMDPAAMGAAAQGGGAAAPPADPSGGAGSAGGAGAGGGPVDPNVLRSIIREELMQQTAAGGGAAGQKIKLDPGVEIHKNNKMLARLIDAMGIQMPATEMVGMEDQAANPQAAAQASADAGGAGAAGGSAIPPISPMQPAGPGVQPQAKQALAREQKVSQMMDQGEGYAPDSILTLADAAEGVSILMNRV